jgi:hypothetical protein
VVLVPIVWVGTAEAGIIIDSDVRYVAVGSSGHDYHGSYSSWDRTDHDGSTPHFEVTMTDWLSSASQDTTVSSAGIFGAGSAIGDEYFDAHCDDYVCYDEMGVGEGDSRLEVIFHVDAAQPFNLLATGHAANGTWLSLIGGILDIHAGWQDHAVDESGVLLPGIQYKLTLDASTVGWTGGGFDAAFSVPEPGTATLLGAGLLGLGVRRRRARGVVTPVAG